MKVKLHNQLEMFGFIYQKWVALPVLSHSSAKISERFQKHIIN